MSKLGMLLGSLTLLSACARTSMPSATVASLVAGANRALDRVVVVSVDGLRAVDGARLPTLGKLTAEGAFAAPPDGALSVMPSVTYPAHTTIVTGVEPNVHGITTNRTIASYEGDDEGEDGDWRRDHRALRATTLYDVAFDAHLRTALIRWPVTLGARATALVPDYRDPEKARSISALRSESTPGFADEIAQRYPPFLGAHLSDAGVMDAALTALSTVNPNLMLVHMTQVDHAQHSHGPDSPEAEAARVNADEQIARMLAALRASEGWERTVLVVTSDHGFATFTRKVAPLVVLAQAGLNERVIMDSGGGYAYFYLRSPQDTEAEARSRELLTTLAAEPSNGVATLLDRSAIAARGGDPRAFLALEPVIGFAVSRKSAGPVVTESAIKGAHGYLSERPQMRAMLLFYGPRVVPTRLEGARLLDVAPTIAPWLGLSLPSAQGRPLPVTLK